jgi:hypothetical protein
MTQFEFDKQYPTAKLLKAVSVTIAEGIFGIIGLYDNGLVQITWKDPCDNARFCDMPGNQYYSLLEAN